MATILTEISPERYDSYDAMQDYEDTDLESLTGNETLDDRRENPVISPSTLVGYDEDVKMSPLHVSPEVLLERDKKMIEYFAGWTSLHAARFRRFLVISNVTEKLRNTGHLVLQTPERFMLGQKNKTRT